MFTDRYNIRRCERNVNTSNCLQYRLKRKIGSGSFGDIYLGTNMTTGEDVAVKLELSSSKHPQLARETKVYRSLLGLGLALRYYGSVCNMIANVIIW